MRRLLAPIAASCLALIVMAPLLALYVRGLPGVALGSAIAASASLLLVGWARRRRLPLELTTLLLLPPAVAWGLGEGWGFFARLPVWDAIAHAVAGFAIGVLGTAFALSRMRADTKRRLLLALLLAVGLAALAGALWEIGEWSSDALLGSRTLGNAGDTVGDLGADLAGALLGGALALLLRGWLGRQQLERLRDAFRPAPGS